jgi:hypothetical protein
MAKVIRLTESDLARLVKRVVKESMDVSSDSEYYKNRKREVSIAFDDLAMMASLANKFCADKENLPDCRRVEDLYYKKNLNR